MKSASIFRKLWQMLCLLPFGLFLLVCSSCNSHKASAEAAAEQPLAAINIIDRNGFAETITASDRLKNYAHVDFLSCQPYQKVLRVYQRDQLGNVRACITSYYPNGQIKQYLDVVNGRASGYYREWHSDGILKLEALVIGGDADLHSGAEQSWLFNGICRSWHAEGGILAEINYTKGILDGDSLYYHPNGSIWKKVPFVHGAMHGTLQVFCNDGNLLWEQTFVQGQKEGEACRYWPRGQKLAAKECYAQDKLVEGCYWDNFGNVIAEVHQGSGVRPLFAKEGIAEMQEYRQGQQEGVVLRYDSQGKLSNKYSIKGGVKHGEELAYYPTQDSTLQPQLSLHWHEGIIHGPVKSWYGDGTEESHREMSNNAKNGLAMAWYRDGSLMLLEEYAQDHLIKGDYYQRAEKIAVSQVREGSGIATLFDPNGAFLRKITYKNGQPFE